jgi:hypothetical protein
VLPITTIADRGAEGLRAVCLLLLVLLTQLQMPNWPLLARLGLAPRTHIMGDSNWALGTLVLVARCTGYLIDCPQGLAAVGRSGSVASCWQRAIDDQLPQIEHSQAQSADKWIVSA